MDCPHIPEMKYSEFSLRLHRQSLETGTPLLGTFELTRRCNLRCSHCYLNMPLSAGGDLETENVERILSEMADEGCLWLLLTGGEPLVRNDFLRLYTFAKKKGFLLTLFTNATLVNAEHVSLLKELKPFRLEVTVYGATEETYERVTRVRGAFRRCMEGIERLASTGVALCLKTVALTTNAHEVNGVEELARRFGASFRFDPMITGRIDGQSGPLEVRLSPTEVVKVDMADPRRVRDWLRVRDELGALLGEGKLLFTCGAGVNSFCVGAGGELLLCTTARSWRYDLTRGPFREGWAQVRQVRKQWVRSRPSPCVSCGLIALCGQCPGWGETEHGDPEKRVEFLCRVAHLRAEYLERISPRKNKTAHLPHVQ